MLYIPVCICLRPAHGMHLWFPSVTIKKYTNSRGQRGVFLIIFSFYSLKTFRYSRASLVRGRLAVFSASFSFFFFFSSLK